MIREPPGIAHPTHERLLQTEVYYLLWRSRFEENISITPYTHRNKLVKSF